jgi:hypothetical protein
MVVFVAAPVPNVRDAIPRVLHLTCFALCVANIIWIVAMYAGGMFLFDGSGRPIPTDFVNVWAAGRLVHEGQAAAAYDWAVHKQMENVAVGYDFRGHFGWHYPPPFLFIAVALAALPYTIALAIWVAATLPLCLAVVRGIVGHPLGWLVAAGFPTVVANLVTGQNGFLTASLIGGTLGLMEKRPVLSGVCLGLLTYKPQFGLLFPLVLIAARKWTVFVTATLVATAIAFLSWLAFGTASWLAFFEWLPATSKAFLSEGKAELGKLQSLFALVRVLGGSEALAWAFQFVLAAVVAAFVCALWRRPVPYELKAAALTAGALLVTPYVYLYDMMVLAIGLAFLVRLGLKSGFHHHELAGLGVAAALLLSFPFVRAPVALGAVLVVALLIALRVFSAPAGRFVPSLTDRVAR